jgi:serine protease AprX
MEKTFRILILLPFLFAWIGFPAKSHSSVETWSAKVEPWVLTSALKGETEFLIYLKQQADLSEAEQFTNKTDKGRYVYEELTRTAELTQKPLLEYLTEQGVEHRSFWIANLIWVRGDMQLVEEIAKRDDVAHLYANPEVKLDTKAVDSLTIESKLLPKVPSVSDSVEWNISKVRAPQVWNAGYTGQGVVIGGQDTGYDWDHPALVNQYRGWTGISADHNYNWHGCDPHCTEWRMKSACRTPSEPCTMTTDMAHTPWAPWSAMMGPATRSGWRLGRAGLAAGTWMMGFGSPAYLLPNAINGSSRPRIYTDENPRPDLAPDVINNSWSCPETEGCTDPAESANRSGKCARSRNCHGPLSRK